MISELKVWAVSERTFLQDEIKWFKGGAKLTSPSGEDITAKKLEQLGLRLEHSNKAIAEQDNADRT